MELKEPKPLGERKIATKDATEQVLDITKEKKLEKKKRIKNHRHLNNILLLTKKLLQMPFLFSSLA